MRIRTAASGRGVQRGPQTGSTLVEIMISLAVMVTAMVAFTRAIVSSIRSTAATREATVAAEASRQLLEALLATNFEDVFALYNADPADDPGGAGTAPGATFTVEGLSPLPDDADGAVGEVVFPTQGNALREDVDDPTLGMPRDLNGDDAIDADDHAGDYSLLPVLVRIRWRGTGGDSSVEFKTVLGPLS